MRDLPIQLSRERIEGFCRKWRIAELSLFGSVLRPDFRPDSDLDVLVSFAADESWDLWDIVAMKEELEALVGRPVDFVEKKTLQNPIRRREILASQEVVYAA